MARIWMDAENTGANVLPRSSRKVAHTSLLGDTGLLQTGKKNVLSSLDNVLYNKPNITPFKGAINSHSKNNNNNAYQKWPMSCAPKLSLCKETLQKQHRKQLAKEAPPLNDVLSKPTTRLAPVAENDLYAKSADPNDVFDLFDFMDFPSAKCLNNCHRPASQNWEEPVLSEDLIDKLLNYSAAFEEELPHGGDDEAALYPDDELELDPCPYYSDNDDSVADLLDDVAPPLPSLSDSEFDLF